MDDDGPLKHHVLTREEWEDMREKIRAEFGNSMLMLRSKMRNELGFTPREHNAWVPKMDGGYYKQEVHIDFYSPQARTWFFLKFL
jgi:hypothetical protein